MIRERPEPVEMRVYGWRIPHTVLVLMLGGMGFGGFRFVSSTTDDTRGRIEGSHLDTIRHIDKAMQPLEKQVQDLTKDVVDLKVQMAALTRGMNDMQGMKPTAYRVTDAEPTPKG